jgi:hypothetical protein
MIYLAFMNERPSEEAQVRSWLNPVIAVAVAPFAGYLRGLM